MHRRSRLFQLSSIAVLAFTSVAFAQETAQTPAAESAGTTAAPAPTGEPSAAPAAEEPSATAAAAAPAAAALDAPQYGLAFRFRWVSVPSWFLGLFTLKNRPLSSYGYALEGFRRKRDKDDPHRTWELSAAIGYQDMSPPDGYWLGKGKDIKNDTDLVQARNFSLITMDAAFISRQYFSPYFGIHYGAGLGLAVVRGKILRTSAKYNQANGQFSVVSNGTTICDANAKCNEAQLSATSQSGGQSEDSVDTPHRFEETSIPGAIPIINLLFGLDFPIPDAKGLEFRVEGGFFDAFFIGGTAGYVF
jgi:hypothetical protein